jgi:hypothetical protein
VGTRYRLKRSAIGTELEYRTDEILDWFFDAYVDKVNN